MTSLVDLWDGAFEHWPLQKWGERCGKFVNDDGTICALAAIAFESAGASLLDFEIQAELADLDVSEHQKRRIADCFDRPSSRAKVRALLAEIDRERGVKS